MMVGGAAGGGADGGATRMLVLAGIMPAALRGETPGTPPWACSPCSDPCSGQVSTTGVEDTLSLWSGETRRAGAPKHRQRFLSVRPGGWSRTPVNSSGTRLTLTLAALDGVPIV